MVGGGDPFYLKFWVNQPSMSEIADFQPIFARSASAVSAIEKSSVNTDRKSITRFPMSLRWSSYVASTPSSKGTQKRKTVVFGAKSHFAWRKSATKVSLYENYQRRSCKAFIGQLSVQKWLLGRPLLTEILGQIDLVGAKSPIFNLFSSVALKP